MSTAPSSIVCCPRPSQGSPVAVGQLARVCAARYNNGDVCTRRTRPLLLLRRAAPLPDDPHEHIVADALGERLTTPKIARSCNQRAGGEIDYPLQSDWLIAQEMHLRGLDGRQPVVEASVQGAPGATVGVGPDFKPKPRSSLDIGATEATIIASNEQEVERLTGRLEKRLAAEGRSVADPSSRREFPLSG